MSQLFNEGQSQHRGRRDDDEHLRARGGRQRRWKLVVKGGGSRNEARRRETADETATFKATGVREGLGISAEGNYD